MVAVVTKAKPLASQLYFYVQKECFLEYLLKWLKKGLPDLWKQVDMKHKANMLTSLLSRCLKWCKVKLMPPTNGKSS